MVLVSVIMRIIHPMRNRYLFSCVYNAVCHWCYTAPLRFRSAICQSFIVTTNPAVELRVGSKIATFLIDFPDSLSIKADVISRPTFRTNEMYLSTKWFTSIIQQGRIEGTAFRPHRYTPKGPLSLFIWINSHRATIIYTFTVDKENNEQKNRIENKLFHEFLSSCEN